MKAEKLFRETAFGGYKREDVLARLKTIDREHREDLEARDAKIAEKDGTIADLQSRIDGLEKEMQMKTELSLEAEALKEENLQLREKLDGLEKEFETLRGQVSEAEKAMESGFACDQAEDGLCPVVAEKAALLLAEADKQAQQKIKDAQEQAAGILLQARVDAQSIMTEAEGESDLLAQKVSDEAHGIIEMTVSEAQNILNQARERGDEILSSSAQSIGKIKGNLSSMQIVVRNIENELKAARESINESTRAKGETQNEQ